MTQVIVAKEKLNCDHLLGQFLDESHYDIVIDFDCDFYAPGASLDGQEISEANCMFKLRKNVFTAEEQRGAYEGLIEAATDSQNRGLAAGPKGEKLSGRDWVTDWQLAVLDELSNPVARLDGRRGIDVLLEEKSKFKEESTRGLVWLRSKIVKDGEEYDGFFDRWLAAAIEGDDWKAAAEAMSKNISATSYANSVKSGIAGFFDRYPRYPYGRVCSYNEKNPDTFTKCFPYIRTLNQKFAELLPSRWSNQREAANRLDSKFTVGGDTVFTTLTINKTFRTAAHRDAGDLAAGFSNLGVISTGKDFTGGYLVLPEFRAAINIRPGDLLLIANHDAIHGNTPIESVTGNPDDVERMSIVAYFRENMLNLGSFDYEQTRKAYVEQRRLNQSHPMWRPLWNGVSERMFDQQEWYDFAITQPNGEEMLDTYHPGWRGSSSADLSDFFS